MVEPIRQTRREKVEAKEAAILTAAQAEFAAKGYDRARISDIARAVGAAEGTFYTYFPNKEALLARVLDDFWARLTDDARDAVAGVDDIFERLARLARRHLMLCLDEFDFMEMTLIYGAPRRTDHTTHAYMRTYVSVFDEIWRSGVDRGQLRADQPLWVARDQFYGALEYSARTLLLRGSREIDLVVDTLLRTLAAGFGVSQKGRISAQPTAVLPGRRSR